jgi:uncharacterized protein with ParB-like and HNH nuclease domain
MNNVLEIEPQKIVDRQIKEKQKTVDYNTREYPVEVIVYKYLDGIDKEENEIFIPTYQRDFVWDVERQSKFIESVLLGLPIPYIFTAEGEDGRLEIIDGSQRIRTLEKFMSNKLKLDKLEILTEANGMSYEDFSSARQRKFRGVSLRMIVLSDKSDEDTRFMIFERINTGSKLLNDMETRRGIYQSEFLDFLDKMTKTELFKSTTAFTEMAEKRREPQELVLRFYAYSDNRENYKGNVNDFLNEYVKDKKDNFNTEKEYEKRLTDVLEFVKENFENGFLQAGHHNKTPRGRFEAIALGIYFALQEKPDLKVENTDWVGTEVFLKTIGGSSTNTITNLNNRIDFVKNKLLASG